MHNISVIMPTLRTFMLISMHMFAYFYADFGIGIPLHFLDKSAHVQVFINCQYSNAQMCTQEDAHAHLFIRAVLDDIMSQNKVLTKLMRLIRTYT